MESMYENEENYELSDLFQVRRPIPVSTIDWTTTHLNQMAPVTGIDFLNGAESVSIQQTVGLYDMMSPQVTENKYTVKVPQGETLYSAEESSDAWQRNCCGSRRAYSLVLYDQTRQFSMQMNRRLACSCCLFGCRLQQIDVWIPPGDYVGYVSQKWTFFTPFFLVYNGAGDILYQIEGPGSIGTCSSYKDHTFNILSSDGLTQLGSIRHQWDQLMVGYNLGVYFPERTVEVREKALLLAAAFLIEYMYFESGKSNRSCSWLC